MPIYKNFVIPLIILHTFYVPYKNQQVVLQHINFTKRHNEKKEKIFIQATIYFIVSVIWVLLPTI